MFKRNLVPVDGSDTSIKALVAGLQLARDSGGRVRILHWLDDFAYVVGAGHDAEVLELARAGAGRVLHDAMDIAKSAGVPSDSRLVEGASQRLGDVVADEAQAWEADLVVVGTHGRHGANRLLLGSGAEHVIRMAPVPVLVVRGSGEPSRS